MRKQDLLVAALAGCALALASAIAHSAEAAAAQKPAAAPASKNSDKWSFDLTPMYFWAAELEGTMGVKGISAPVDLGFSDILDALDFAGTLRLEGHRGRWGFFFDGTYLHLSKEIDGSEIDLSSALPSMSLPTPKIPGPMLSPTERRELLKAILRRLPPDQRKRVLRNIIPRAKGAVGKLRGAAAAAAALKRKLSALRLPSIDEVEIGMTMSIVEAGLSYRCLEVPLGNSETRVLSLEALAGARYTYMKSEIDIDITPGSFGMLPASVSMKKSVDWIEPLVGGRIKLGLTDRLNLAVRGDVGGFGIGSASQLTWQVLAGLQYRISDSTSVTAGYRHYNLDYEKGSGSDKFAMDIEIKGPIFGLTVLF